jgi:hypothetical protein
MSTISIECDVTEFAVIPDINYQKVIFCFSGKAMVISFMDDDNRVLTQSEIEITDAVSLAKLILLKQNL